MVHHVLHPFGQNTSQQVFFFRKDHDGIPITKDSLPSPSHNSRASISGKSSSLSKFGMQRRRTHPFLHTAQCLKIHNCFLGPFLSCSAAFDISFLISLDLILQHETQEFPVLQCLNLGILLLSRHVFLHSTVFFYSPHLFIGMPSGGFMFLQWVFIKK